MLRWLRIVNNRRVARVIEMYRLAFMKAYDVFSWLERPLSGLVICKLRMVRQFLILACVLTVGLWPAIGYGNDGPEFSSQVAPLLNKYCAGCHNVDSSEGGLSLESYADIFKGGMRGPVVLAGQSESSRLLRVLTGSAEPRMPPEDEPQLKAAEIELLKEWIDAGALGPSGVGADRVQLIVPKILPQHQLGKSITSLDVSADGGAIAIARFGEIHLFGPDLGDVQKRLNHPPGKINMVSFAGQGAKLVAASGTSGLFGEARLWDVAEGKLLHTFRGHRDSILAVAISPDGEWLATGSYDRKVMIWNTNTGEPVRTLAGHNGAIFDVAFSPDGRVLATASADATIKLWSVATGERLDTLSQPLEAQYCVAFSPDGSRVFAGGADSRIRAWQLVSIDKPQINPILFSRYAHEAPVVRLSFSQNGQELVSSAEDRTVKLWDAENLIQAHVFEAQSDIVNALDFVSNQRRIVVGRMDGTFQLYQLPEIQQESAATEPEAHGSVPVLDFELTEVSEQEPNDSTAQAMLLKLPAVVKGVIHAQDAESDIDLYQIDAKAGQTWMIEVDAARSDSSLDSMVRVLDANGKPVLRLLLEAVRDTYIKFRPVDSQATGARLANWSEMELNQYLYMNGEVTKFFRMPRGPDGEMMFYHREKTRLGYFDTTAVTHSFGEPCYVVRPHAPGTKLIPNGLPIFPLYFENDDDGLRKWGTDSRLTFVVPEDGTYYVCVKDTRGLHGPDFKYQLVMRPSQPDYQVAVHDADLAVPPGSGKLFRIAAERMDGFDGEVSVNINDVPPGFWVSSPLVIQSGHKDAFGVLYAAPDAVSPTAENSKHPQVIASAEISGTRVNREVVSLGEIKLGEPTSLKVFLESMDQDPTVAPPTDALDEGLASLPEVVLMAGGQTQIRLRVERGGFDGRISFTPYNLPHGVIVDNIGLNGIQLQEGQTERVIFLTAESWVKDTSRPFFFVATEENKQASRPMILHLQQP